MPHVKDEAILRRFIRESMTRENALDEFTLLAPLLFSKMANAPGPCDPIRNFDVDTLFVLVSVGLIAAESGIIPAAASGARSLFTFSSLGTVLRVLPKAMLTASFMSNIYGMIEVYLSKDMAPLEKRQQITKYITNLLVDVLIYRLTLGLTNPVQFSGPQALSEASSFVTRILQAIIDSLKQPSALGKWLLADLGITLSIDQLFGYREDLSTLAAEVESGEKLMTTFELIRKQKAAGKAAGEQARKDLLELEDFKRQTRVTFSIAGIPIETVTDPLINCAVEQLSNYAAGKGYKESPIASSRSAKV